MRKTDLLLIAVVSLTVLSVAACGPSAPDDSGGDTSEASTSDSTDTSDSTTGNASASETGGSPHGSTAVDGSTGISDSGDESESGGKPSYNLLVSLSDSNGSFWVTDADSMSIVWQEQGSNCRPDPVEEGYFTCQAELTAGAYIVEFGDVPGLNTPGAQGVDLDGVDDHVHGDYN